MEDLNLDWGQATPEFYHPINREALHVLNVNFVGEENRARVVKFVVARVLHFHKHLPAGSSQRIRFDLRGQAIGSKNLESARQTILHAAAQHGIDASVDFLTN